jgi:DNA-binding NarL/FixJ family response regulator
MHGARAMSEVLTPRQCQVLLLVADGHCSKQIARRLGVHRRTIEKHREEVSARCGVHEVAGMVRAAIRWGWIVA